MKKGSQEFLRALLNQRSPSGSEAPIQRVWADYTRQFADEVHHDAYGNSWAVLNPKGRPRILVSGHADEIGYMVKFIDDQGFIYLDAIGGPDVTLAKGQRVVIHTHHGEVIGVVGALAKHLQEKGKEGVPEIHDLFIDIGASSAEEVQQKVSIGDSVTFQVGMTELNEKVWTARGCDNRIGIFAAAETLRLCASSKKPKACVIAASTIQEENGLYGARMIADSVEPDLAVVVDVGHATDVPTCDPKKHGQVKLGGGPMLSKGACNHPVVVERIQWVARQHKIPIQMVAEPRFTGSDADAIFVQRGGIPTALVSLPNRYMHTPVETIHLDDLDQISQLASAFILDVKRNETFSVSL